MSSVVEKVHLFIVNAKFICQSKHADLKLSLDVMVNLNSLIVVPATLHHLLVQYVPVMTMPTSLGQVVGSQLSERKNYHSHEEWLS